MSQTPTTTPRRAGLRFQEGGLVAVILLMGAYLTFFGGTVKQPVFEAQEDGTLRRVFVTNAEGRQELLMEEKNKFLNARNLAQIAKDTSFIAIMAVGATFVIISGGIDLSVGAIYALASVLGAMVLRYYGPEGPGFGAEWTGALLGMTVCIGVGALCGLINGTTSVALGVHPFIITLGAMAVFRGIAFVITGGQSITGFPEIFRDWITWETSQRVSLTPMLVTVLVAVVGWIYLSRLAAGRRVYAVGGNEVASRYSGIRVSRVKLGVFVISGTTAGIAAMLAIGYYGGASSADGTAYELSVIAAAVVGGASLSGGKGSALGAVLGALVIQMIDSGIVILGIDQDWSQIIIGTVIVLAVVLDRFNSWFAKRRLARGAGT